MNLSEKSRKLLKMVYRGLGVSAITLALNGCWGGYVMYGPKPMYGVPDPDRLDDVEITGIIHDQYTHVPIPGIKVSVQGLEAHTLSYGGGRFYLYVPEREVYQLKFEDVDGIENGVYQAKEMTVVLADASNLGTIHLNPEE